MGAQSPLHAQGGFSPMVLELPKAPVLVVAGTCVSDGFWGPAVMGWGESPNQVTLQHWAGALVPRCPHRHRARAAPPVLLT